MKKLLFLMLFSTLFSCEKMKENIATKSASLDGMSMIEELEASGTKLFKKDITVFDATKKSSAIIRIAAVNQEVLDEYLTNQFILIVSSPQSISQLASKVSTDVPNTEHELKINETIYHQYISVNLEEGMKSYGTKIIEKINKNKNARIGYTVNNDWWESPSLFASTAQAFWLSTTNSNNGIYFAMRYKPCGVCGWQNPDGPNDQGTLDQNNQHSIVYANNQRRLAVVFSHNWNNRYAAFTYY